MLRLRIRAHSQTPVLHDDLTWEMLANVVMAYKVMVYMVTAYIVMADTVMDRLTS